METRFIFFDVEREGKRINVNARDEAWLIICIKLEIVTEEVVEQKLSLGGGGGVTEQRLL
jgi:hypothetical protein